MSNRHGGGPDTEALKKELMTLLAAKDRRALTVINRLKKEAQRTDDAVLLGYAYYRYAYYYYFTSKDIRKFRRYLPLAIRHLLRSGDQEYLAGAYNFVAYEAQDHGCYDIAYAYFMMALEAAGQVEGISLPGIVEANAGRLMTELGDPKTGRGQIRSAIRRLRPFTSMYVYHYNMIITYADEALASFLLRDSKGTERVLRAVEKHFGKANESERELALTYYILPAFYHALLTHNAEMIREKTKALCRRFHDMKEIDFDGMIFELESLFRFMLDNGYKDEAKRLLDATRRAAQSDNLTTVLRYTSMSVRYHEACGNVHKLRKALLFQREIGKRQNEERIRMYRYATEFVEGVERIAKERVQAMEEHDLLQVQANTDALTSLPNRNDMNRQLTAMLDRAYREQSIFGIGIMDLDRFKDYNDTFGHQAGDACLKLIGDVLLSHAGENGIYCARYGGDEFVVCFEGCTGKEIRRLASNIQKEITARAKQSEGSVRAGKISVSFGICHATPDGKRQVWDYLSAADKALYRIKKQGGGKTGVTKDGFR